MINTNFKQKTNVTYPSFQGVSALDKTIGEKIVREIRGLGLRSPSSIASRRWCLEQKGITVPDNINNFNSDLTRTINRNRFWRNLSENEAINLKLGNCGEMADMAEERAKKFYKEVDKIGFKMENNVRDRNVLDHYFPVVRLDKNKKGFDLNKPHTWGKDAMIIDPWTGVVDAAQQGLLKIYNALDIQNRLKLFVRGRYKNLSGESQSRIYEYATKHPYENIKFLFG